MNTPKVTPERKALDAALKHLRAGRPANALIVLDIYAKSLGAK